VEKLNATQDGESQHGQALIEPTKLTGFQRLDALLEGLVPGELILIDGLQAIARSDFVFSLASKMAYGQKSPVALCTPNNSLLHCLLNLISNAGQIDRGRLLSGNLTDLEWPKLTSAMNRFQSSPLFVYADETAKIEDLSCLLIDMKKYHGLGAVFIDSLSDLKATVFPDDNPLAETHSIIKSLRLMTAELGVPLVAAIDLAFDQSSAPKIQAKSQDSAFDREIYKLVDRILFLHPTERNFDKVEKSELVEVILKPNMSKVIDPVYFRYREKHGAFSECETGNVLEFDAG
jgi:replicative DNA helicase